MLLSADTVPDAMITSARGRRMAQYTMRGWNE